MGKVLTVHHPKGLSQFSFGGYNSCTYCTLEASLYYLHGFLDRRDKHEELHNVIEAILKQGVYMDKNRDKHEAPDEVLESVDRYSNLLSIVKISNYNLMKIGELERMLTSAETLSKNTSSRIAVCLTYPPETFGLFYDHNSDTYCIFDSHLNNRHGAYITFANKSQCVAILEKKLNLSQFKKDEGEVRGSLEATFVQLGHLKTFMDPFAFESAKTSNSLPPRPKSQLLYSLYTGAVDSQSVPSQSVSSPLQMSQLHSSLHLNEAQSHILGRSFNYTQENAEYMQIIQQLVKCRQESVEKIENLKTQNTQLMTEIESLRVQNKKLQEEKENDRAKIHELEAKFTKVLSNTAIPSVTTLLQEKDELIQSQSLELRNSRKFLDELVDTIQKHRKDQVS